MDNQDFWSNPSEQKEQNNVEVSGIGPSGLKLTSGFKSASRTQQESFANKSIENWLDSLRNDCNIWPYWRIHDKLYDLTEFINKHPGGKYWLEMTQGIDITEAFESARIRNEPKKILAKYFVQDISTKRISPFTFKDEGFYMTLKKKAEYALRGIDHGPTTEMKLFQDSLFVAFLSTLFYGIATSSYMVIILARFLLTFSTICAHNFIHQKDNWRMYIFDFSLLSSRIWRISNAISHHLYTNTIQDYEIIELEPFVELFPIPEKNFFQKYFAFTPLNAPLFTASLVAYFINWYHILIGKKAFEYPYVIQPVLVILMIFISNSVTTAFALWLILHMSSTFFDLLIGWQAGHHSHYAYIESDPANKYRDWGLHQVIVIAGRKATIDNLYFASVSFGNHTLHHLFPTLDQSRLHLLMKPLLETCEEFGVNFTVYSMWDVFLSMFYRFYNNQPNERPIKIKFRNNN